MPATPRVAIVGAGPSGFYAAEAVFDLGIGAEVSMIDRLPSPFGLVRSGVAPDHPNLKKPIETYDAIARQPGFRYFGNVEVGRDVSVDELLGTHHAVVLCYGASRDAPLGIPGENLAGSHAATEFVGWYNGHPEYRDCRFDLSQESAVIIGQGNVALDVARILLRGVDELRKTDIAEHALDALAASRLREIRIIGRRGPAQAKFTPRELEEIGTLPAADVRVSPADLVLNPASAAEAAARTSVNVKKNLGILARYALSGGGGSVACYFNFLESPLELAGDGRVERMRLAKNALEGEPFAQRALATGAERDVACGLVFRAVGYRGDALPGVPFDARRGVIEHQAGRVTRDGAAVPGLYAAGWIKRGATGIIGTNRACSVETVDSLGADIAALAQAERPGSAALAALLAGRGVRSVDYAAWLRIDAEELRRGGESGRPRSKFTRVDDMLGVALA
ncbi:MAG: FAD-dependent oxidoreductase [Burkholderiales bacterium]